MNHDEMEEGNVKCFTGFVGLPGSYSCPTLQYVCGEVCSLPCTQKENRTSPLVWYTKLIQNKPIKLFVRR